MNWYKISQKTSLLSSIVTLYILDILSGTNPEHQKTKLLYAQNVKEELVRRLVEAVRIRTQRIADRISVDYSSREEELLESGVLDSPAYQWLKEVIYSGNIDSYLTTIYDYKKFYTQLHSPAINEVYPRGERNNKPWIEIIDAVINIEQSKNSSDLLTQVDSLKSIIHNVPESVLYLIPEGPELIEFFDLTHGSNYQELYKFMFTHMDKGLISPNELKEIFPRF